MLFIKALDGRVGGGWAGVEGSSAVFPNTWACIRDLWGEKPHYRDLVAFGVWRKRRNRGSYSVTHVGFFSAIMAHRFEGPLCSSFFDFYSWIKIKKVTFRITVFNQIITVSSSVVIKGLSLMINETSMIYLCLKVNMEYNCFYFYRICCGGTMLQWWYWRIILC